MKKWNWLDWALRITLVLVVAAGAYLGYAVWSHNRRVEATAPATRALKDLQAYVRKNPNDANARVALAETFLATGRTDEALTQYNEALRIDKKHIGALNGLGLLSMHTKEFTKAEGHWRKIIKLLQKGEFANKDQRLEKAYFYLGQTLIEMKEYEDAIGYLRQAIYIRPDASDTHYSLAVAYRELEIRDKQREELETALAFDPMMPEANYDLGLLLLKEGDEAGAAERFRLSADKAPKGIDKPQVALEGLGTAEERYARARSLASRDTSAALTHGRVALALNPDSNEIALFVAGLYEKAGKKQQARDLFERVLERDVDNKTAKDAIARLNRGK